MGPDATYGTRGLTERLLPPITTPKVLCDFGATLAPADRGGCLSDQSITLNRHGIGKGLPQCGSSPFRVLLCLLERNRGRL